MVTTSSREVGEIATGTSRGRVGSRAGAEIPAIGGLVGSSCEGLTLHVITFANFFIVYLCKR